MNNPINFPVGAKQQEACDHLYVTNFCGIAWHKPGEGKTRLALMCALWTDCPRVLIVCPKKARDSWIDEITKIKFDRMFQIVSADSLHKVDTSKSFGSTFLIVDELYYFANPNSIRSKRLKFISKFFPHRIGLSGTIQPAGDNFTIWGQMSALNLEKFLARNATAFRSTYQEKVFSPFGQSKRKQINKPGSIDAICRKIAPYVHVNFPDSAHRNIRHAVVDVAPTAEQLTAINQVREEYQLALESGEMILDYKTAMEIMFTVCKITNGWVNNLKGTGETGIVKEFDCGKLSRLEAILDPLIADGQRVVIWCMFRNDVEYLQRHLKYKCLRFIGGEDFDTKTWASGPSPLVLATAASGASVNYFGNVEYAIYYSLPIKLTDFIQSKARHERKNSEHGGAFYYYLVGKQPSFDSRILARLESNNECEQEIIKGLAKEFLT